MREKGGSKPLDSLKMVLKSLLGNVTKRSAQRVACSLETLDEVMDEPKSEEVWRPWNKGSGAVKIILTDLMNGNVFHHTHGRCGYPSFKNMKKSVNDIDFCDFVKWAHDHLLPGRGFMKTPKEIIMMSNYSVHY